MKIRARFSDYFLVGLFFIVIIAAFVEKQFKLFPAIPNTENRAMASKPIWNIALLDPFPLAYEAYYNDHFPFRNYFVRWYSQLCYYVFDKSPQPDKVIIGHKNELYLIEKELNTYTGKGRFTEKECDLITTEFKRRKAFFKEQGMLYYMVICPIKYTIYPEYLPWYVVSGPGDNLTDQFVAAVKQSGVPLIDLRTVLLEAKETYRDQLFWQTDNHWSEIGAFLGYRKIMESIAHMNDRVLVTNWDDYRVRMITNKGGNLSSLTNMQDEMFDTRFKFTPLFESQTSMILTFPFPHDEQMKINEHLHGFQMRHSDAPKLLMVHDSFGRIMIPFLKDSFSRSVFVWDFWQYGVNEQIVRAENPDVVITMTLESLLPNLVSNIQKQ